MHLPDIAILIVDQLEGAVILEAADVIASGKPTVMEFGVADETAWEVGLACGGRIKVYVEKLETLPPEETGGGDEEGGLGIGHLGLHAADLGVKVQLEPHEREDADHRDRNAAVPVQASLIARLALCDRFDVGAEGIDQVVGLDDQAAALDDLLLDLAHLVVDVSGYGQRADASRVDQRLALWRRIVREAGLELAEIDAIANNEEPATFENTIEAMQGVGKDLDRVGSYRGIWSSNMSSPEFREIQMEMAIVIY